MISETIASPIETRVPPEPVDSIVISSGEMITGGVVKL